MKHTTLDSREFVCVRERKAKPAFSSNGNVVTVAVGRSESELKRELLATCGRNQNDTSKTPLLFLDRLLRPHPSQRNKKRLRSEWGCRNGIQMKKTTLDSREIVCVRGREAKPAFSSNGNVVTVGRAVAQI